MATGIDPFDLIYEIIIPACRNLNALSIDAVGLMLGTVANESGLGNRLDQQGLEFYKRADKVRSGGLGIWQMEKATHDSLVDNYLKYNGASLKACFLRGFDSNLLITDMLYGAMFARLQYMQHPQAIPSFRDAAAIAAYYKTYYNTSQGQATLDRFVLNYNPLLPILSQIDINAKAV